LSIYHTLVGTNLEEGIAHNENSFSNLAEKSSTSIEAAIYGFPLFFLLGN
jgi:hypothetical protein